MQLENYLSGPRLLQRLEWLLNPVNYMDSGKQQYPDIFRADLIGLSEGIIFVNHPQGIQEILNSKKFTAPGEPNAIVQPLVGDYSVILLSGSSHKKRRQLLTPPFHGERMRAYGQLICNLTRKVMNQFTLGETFLARDTMQQISLQTILEAVFGLSEGKQYQRLRELLLEMSQLFISPLTSATLFFTFLQKDLGAISPWGKFLRTRKAIDELLFAEIAERRKDTNTERADILSLLMSARDEQGQPMSDQELRDELMTLLFAGNDTTATAMSWAVYWIHSLPEVKNKLLTELETLGNNPDPGAISRIPYLTAVCQETLRIYPVGMLTFPRVNPEPTEILGYEIAANSIVAGCIYLVHHREEIYPQPKVFNPERFLNHQFSPYEFIPFGNGTRRCIGEALALYEMKLVVATLLLEYDLALVDKTPEPPKRRGVTLGPGHGVKTKIISKKVNTKNIYTASLSSGC